MKKLLGLTMAAILLVSCSDDDSSSSVSAEKLIGKWYPTTTQIKGLKAEPYENDCATAKDYTEFKANGVGTDVYYDTDCDSNSDNITYTLTGKKITINFDEEFTLTGTIQSLSSSKLVILEDYDLNDDGTNDTTITLTLTK